MGDASAYVDYLKVETYADKYFDKFPLSNSDLDILANVVPLPAQSDTLDDFFGPEVCNVIVLTGNYKFPDDKVADAKARIRVAWSQFKKYECHFIIDKSEANIQCMSDSDKSDLEDRVQALCTELGDFNFTFHGSLEGGAITAEIDKILEAFYNPTP